VGCKITYSEYNPSQWHSVVYKVAIRQVSVKVFRFSLSVSFQHCYELVINYSTIDATQSSEPTASKKSLSHLSRRRVNKTSHYCGRDNDYDNDSA
jgi:hypothetical protein